jgi:hypothetical protein
VNSAVNPCRKREIPKKANQDVVMEIEDQKEEEKIPDRKVSSITDKTHVHLMSTFAQNKAEGQ